jgi:hypothetical protein
MEDRIVRYKPNTPTRNRRTTIVVNKLSLISIPPLCFPMHVNIKEAKQKIDIIMLVKNKNQSNIIYTSLRKYLKSR